MRIAYCCTAKLLKETETEETIAFFVTFLSWVAFQLGGGGGAPEPPWLRLCFSPTSSLFYERNTLTNF